MAELELHPKSMGEMLDRSFRLYRGHFALFAALMASPATFECGRTSSCISLRASGPTGAAWMWV
jgi:hypothetical protein